MSLHLIESRAKSSALVLRRPGGNVVSFAMHASLITCAVLATSTPPSFAREPKVVQALVYVHPPTSPLVHQAPASQALSSQSQPTLNAPPPFIAPVNILTVIPDIPAVSVGSTEINPHQVMGSGIGSPNGLPGGAPGGLGSGSDVFSEPQVDRAVMLLPGMPVPRYPEQLRSAGIQDTVTTNFIVDSIGKVETSSIQFPSTTLAAFSNAIRESLTRARFRPAEVAGRPVRQRVEQAFIFSLTR